MKTIAETVGVARSNLVNRLPAAIEWLSDNGSPYTAGKTRAFAGEIGLVPRTTPIESPAVKWHG